ncbi:MAG: hypothetical protein WC496_06705 [Phycisphaerae bacterium]
MRKKIIYIITFIMAMSLTFITYGDVVIGNFEDLSDPCHEGWVKANPSDPNITLSYSKTGVTLDSNSLKIADSTGNGFERAISKGLMGDVNAFRDSVKISLDLTRLASDWDGPHGGWDAYGNFLGWNEFYMIIEAGSTDANVGKGVWAKGWQLPQIANWGSWNGDDPITYIYDYSLILNQIDFNNLTYLGVIFASNWGNYDSGGVYYLDNIKLIGEGMAYEPSPTNHEVDVAGGSNLIWSEGAGAVTHDVYFGTNFNDVNDANRTNPMGVLKSEDQDANVYTPTLALYKTYYWRIDEVNSLGVITKGEVWDFMTEYAGMGLVLGDWDNGLNGWEKTWQGKTTLSHASLGTTLGDHSLAVQTVKNTVDDPGYWIIKHEGVLDLTNMKLQVDVTLLAAEWTGQTVTLGPLVVQSDLAHTWSSYTASVINRLTGGFASNTWSGTSNAYRTLIFDFTGTDADGYIHTDWTDANKMTIMLALQNGAEGPGKFYLDNARLVNIRLANAPRPGTLATDINTTPTIGWTKGKDATSHDVYFGTDEAAVTDATTSNPLGVFKGNQAEAVGGLNKYVPGLLAKNTTYYWRIDERGAAGSPWKGLIWHFTTAEYVFVEDFEFYNNTSRKIYNTWIQGGGGKVGYDTNDRAEISIIHGGLQSMPFDYNNLVSPYDSNATRTFTSSRDWTAESVKSLELWVRGWPISVGSFTGSDPYTITASGEDVWNVPDLRGSKYHDECHYAYKKVTAGDEYDYVTIIAKVNSISNTSPWAKAGVMVRQSLDPNSKNGFMCITPEMGAAWQYRENDANLSTSYDYYTRPAYTGLKDINAPYWVKLEIDTYFGYVDAYYSADGSIWHHVDGAGYPTITLPLYVGLAVTAHNSAATCTAEFSDVSIIAGTASSWGHQDIGIKSNIAAPLYVTLQDDSTVGGDKATVTQTDPNMVIQNTWQAWDIDLNDFKVNNPNLNLEKIKKITLGVGHRSGDPYGKGTLYFDDIRLYLPRCMPGKTPDFNGDCFVDYDDLREMAGKWLSSPVDPDVDLNDDSKINFQDFAILASQWYEAALWPF